MSDQEETITITVTHNKKDHEITVPLTSSIKHFKNQVHRCTNVPPSLQKYILKSTVSNKVPKDASTKLKSREDDTMEQLGLKSGTKALLIGSTIDQVIAVTTPNVMSSTSSSSNLRKLQNTENNDNDSDEKQGGIKLSEMKEHAKVVSKGVPTGAEVGDRNKDVRVILSFCCNFFWQFLFLQFFHFLQKVYKKYFFCCCCCCCLLKNH